MSTECPICSGTLSESICYPGSIDAPGELSFQRIGLCGHCGGGTALPRPEEQALNRFYSSGSYWKPGNDRSRLAHAACQANVRLRVCIPYLDANFPARVADIGAGHGLIGQELARSGLKIAGYECVEPDESAGSHIGSYELPFPVRHVRTVGQLESGFNLIFLNQVLEHVADPISFLKAAISRAVPGSIVYVETPNLDYRFKSDVFPHTFFYSTRSLEALGNNICVETLRCEQFGLWPSPKSTLRGLMQRVASRAMIAGSRFIPSTASRVLDRFIWRYDTVGLDSCIWLRWIFRV